MIDKNKQYRTRSGLPVRIYATDCGGDYPVHGATCFGDIWHLCFWTKDGFFTGNEGGLDLIEVKPRIQATFWVNVNPHGPDATIYKSKEIADSWAGPERKACLEITIDCEEGEGL